MLAQIKVHIPTKSLERGIVMPRDLDVYHPQMPKVVEHLMVNPFKEKKDEKKKKKRKAGEDTKMMRAADNSKAKDLMAGGPLLRNERLQYQVHEFENFPCRQGPGGEWKPKAGVFRMMLPSEADWNARKNKDQLDEEQKKIKGI